MKIIIVGGGTIGQTLVEDLANEGHNITVIEKDAKKLENIVNRYDVLGICGNGATLSILKEAKVGSADVLAAMTESDEANLLTCFLAHKLGCKDTVARVRDTNYTKQQIQFMKDDLGLSMVINPEYEVAEAIYTSLAFPNAINVESFAKGKMQLVGLKVEKDSLLEGLSLMEINSKLELKVLVCAVERKDEVFIPVGSFILQEGDKIHVAAEHSDLLKFFQKISNEKVKSIKNAIILGGSRTSYNLCQFLNKTKANIKLIEKDELKAASFAEDFNKIAVIRGDIVDHSLLEEEGIDDVDVLLALSDNDITNIMLSLFAKQKGAKKVITTINNTSISTMMDEIGVSSVYSSRHIVADEFVSYIRAKDNKRGNNVITLYKLVNQKIEAIEFHVSTSKSYVNKPLKTLHFKHEALIAGIIRNGAVIIPNGNDTILVDDSVIVITKDSMLDDLGDIIG